MKTQPQVLEMYLNLKSLLRDMEDAANVSFESGDKELAKDQRIEVGKLEAQIRLITEILFNHD